MTEYLDWVEKAAQDNFRAHEKTQEAIAREASTTFGWIVAAGVAALSFIVRPEWSGPVLWMKVLLGALALFLGALAFVLLWRCMRFGSFPSPTNEPKNLYQPSAELRLIREEELQNMQVRIEEAGRFNGLRADSLNAVRVWAAAGLGAAAILALALMGYFAAGE